MNSKLPGAYVAEDGISSVVLERDGTFVANIFGYAGTRGTYNATGGGITFNCKNPDGTRAVATLRCTIAPYGLLIEGDRFLKKGSV